MGNIEAIKAFFYPNLARAIILAQNAGFVLLKGYDRYTVQMQKQGFFSNKNLFLQLDANGTVHLSRSGENHHLRRNSNTPVPEYYYQQIDREREERQNTRYYNCLLCGRRVKQGKGLNGDWWESLRCDSCGHYFEIENGTLHMELVSIQKRASQVTL